ncbi:TIGR02269 family lipoprotein [Myxococcaceae bacterium GXIMD 01537]
MSPRVLGLLVGSALLAACASTPSRPSEEREVPEGVSSYEEGCEDERSVILLCARRECAFFRCRDQESGGVVLARGNGVIAPSAAPGGRPGRWWGVWPWMRRDAEPVLTFRFYRHAEPKPPVQQLPAGRYVRHHIFPQAPDLAAWFRQQGVENIHNFTMVIPEHIHLRIHSGGPRGGLWNEAWRHFKENNPNAAPAEIYAHAGQLIFRFNLEGPITPYYRGR